MVEFIIEKHWSNASTYASQFKTVLAGAITNWNIGVLRCLFGRTWFDPLACETEIRCMLKKIIAIDTKPNRYVLRCMFVQKWFHPLTYGLDIRKISRKAVEDWDRDLVARIIERDWFHPSADNVALRKSLKGDRKIGWDVTRMHNRAGLV